MSALDGSVVLSSSVMLTPVAQGEAASAFASLRFSKYGYSNFGIISEQPEQFERLAEAALATAQLLRERITPTETPAPAASSPVPQADAGAVDPAAAPAPRTADPGFIPPESHVGESATVTMGQSSSICSACRRGCLPSDAVHDWCYGYGPQGPGCGATFTRVINPYVDVRGGTA